MPPFAILFVQHGLKTCFLWNLADKGSINIHTLRFLWCHVQTEMPQTETIRLMVSAIYFVAVCFPKMSETRPFLNKDLKFFLGSIVSRITGSRVVWIQGLYRSWKTWKVMEFKNFIFQAWKVMKFNCRSWKVMEN